MQWICPQFDTFQNLACQYPPFVKITDIITGDGQVKQILIETHVKSSFAYKQVRKYRGWFYKIGPGFLILLQIL